MLISKHPGDTEGGQEKTLPSLEIPLMTLKSSFLSYSGLDDIDIRTPDEMERLEDQ